MNQKLNTSLLMMSMCLFFKIFSQQGQIPYLRSNIGLGSELSESIATEKAQGELSVVRSGTHLSFTNPALLSDLKLTSFNGSVQFSKTDFSIKKMNHDKNTISFSDLSFGFPIGTNGGFMTGLRLRSSAAFEIDSKKFYDYGDGGVYQSFIAGGYQIFKRLSIGMQTSFYFGRIIKKHIFKETIAITADEKSFNLSGVSFKIGTCYTYRFNEKLEGQIGSYITMSHDIIAEGISSHYDVVKTDKNKFQRVKKKDPHNKKNISGKEINPTKTAFGVGLMEENNWFTGISIELQNAPIYQGDIFFQTDNSNVKFQPGYKISFGANIIPDKNSLKNYSKKINYSMGCKYQNTKIAIENNPIKNLGLSIGFGLPIGNGTSYINFILEGGLIGDSNANYKEKYINFGLSLSFSDKWFIKRTIE